MLWNSFILTVGWDRKKKTLKRGEDKTKTVDEQVNTRVHPLVVFRSFTLSLKRTHMQSPIETTTKG